MNCLSGNVFVNHILNSYNTNITSCFRKGLTDGIYQNVEPTLFNDVMHVIINDTSENATIISADDSFIALDNVNITILSLNNKEPQIILAAHHGYIILIESYIVNAYDIPYYNQPCTPLNNNRSSNSKQYISS